MSANQQQVEDMVKEYARDEIVGFIDILIRIFEKGEIKDPVEILRGARNAVVKRHMQPLVDQMEGNVSGQQSDV